MPHTVDYSLAKDSEYNDQGNHEDYRFYKKKYERCICCLSVVILLLVIGAAVMAYFLYGFYTANITLNQRLINENDCRDGLMDTTDGAGGMTLQTEIEDKNRNMTKIKICAARYWPTCPVRCECSTRCPNYSPLT